MEFEDVSERIEWEARRAAAALGVSECPPMPLSVDEHLAARHFFEAYAAEDWVEWNVADAHLGCLFIIIGLRGAEHEHSCFDRTRLFGTQCKPHPHYNAQMVRALYRLGIDDENTATQFDYSLTAHEKIELRLSMPREFWPSKWLHEIT